MALSSLMFYPADSSCFRYPELWFLLSRLRETILLSLGPHPLHHGQESVPRKRARPWGLPHELPAVRDHDLVMPVTCCCKTIASYFVRFYSCLWLKNNPVWFLHHRQPAVIVYFYLFSKYFLSVYNVGGIRNTGLNKWHDPCPQEVYSLWGKMDLKQIIIEINLWFKLW